VEVLSLTGCMDKTSKRFRPYFVHADNTLCGR
jgi:hypothetical protein